MTLPVGTAMSVPFVGTKRLGVSPRWRTKKLLVFCVSTVPPTEVWAELNQPQFGVYVHTALTLWLRNLLLVVDDCDVPRKPSADSNCR